MPHLNTQPGQHDHTASVFLFRTDSEEPRVMLHLHRKLGGYMQFGGHIELDETPWQTVVHELREESGYDINQLSILQPKDRITTLTDAVVHPQPVVHSTHPVNKDGHYHIDSAYIAVTEEDPHNEPDENESKDIRTFTRQEILDLPNDKIITNIREIILHIFDIYLLEWLAVPADTFK